MRVWLSNKELDTLIDYAETPHQRLAFLLGGRVGLRRSEIIRITPNALVKSPTGKHVRIWEDYTKRDHYREPPIPDNVEAIADTLAFEQADDEPLIDVDGTTVYRWVQKAASNLEGQTGDEGWTYLDVHDLRRTWGTSLLEQGVLPSVVMAWGGWTDWDTFRDHCLGEFSPEAIKRERSKVDFLNGSGHGTEPENRLSTLPPVGSDTGMN
ncbi:site-specific integrase [Natrinema sp. 1APR25-10V2]|uniref:site-specific integrase n=1 Tax=Natrinema sp. 1APR25-10V2 TaxID=2951081 RepID=UPI00287B7876|nr:site-specific integrase [Natrinema sp. 1APR25-10V2]